MLHRPFEVPASFSRPCTWTKAWAPGVKDDGKKSCFPSITTLVDIRDGSGRECLGWRTLANGHLHYSRAVAGAGGAERVEDASSAGPTRALLPLHLCHGSDPMKTVMLTMNTADASCTVDYRDTEEARADGHRHGVQFTNFAACSTSTELRLGSSMMRGVNWICLFSNPGGGDLRPTQTA